MLFQNLYEDILVRQKLKTKHGNSLINSKYSNSDPLLDEQDILSIKLTKTHNSYFNNKTINIMISNIRALTSGVPNVKYTKH